MKKSVTNESASVLEYSPNVALCGHSYFTHMAQPHSDRDGCFQRGARIKHEVTLDYSGRWPLPALSRMVAFTKLNWLHLCIEITAVHPATSQ